MKRWSESCRAVDTAAGAVELQEGVEPRAREKGEASWYRRGAAPLYFGSATPSTRTSDGRSHAGCGSMGEEERR